MDVSEQFQERGKNVHLLKTPLEATLLDFIAVTQRGAGGDEFVGARAVYAFRLEARAVGCGWSARDGGARRSRGRRLGFG